MSPLRLLPQPYQDPIRALHQEIGADFCLTGGWALSNLLQRSYAGDIDILTTASQDRVLSAATSLYRHTFNSPLGAVRVQLPDNNYVDITSTRLFGDSTSIGAALDRYNFSANSVAIDLDGGHVHFGGTARDDIANRFFRVNELYAFEQSHFIPNLRRMDFLEFFFGFRPARDEQTMSMDALRSAHRQRYLGSDASRPLRQMANAAASYLPPGRPIWLVRGIVGAAITGSITYWDDIDVIVPCSNQGIFEFLDSAGLAYTLNFFGCPKVTLADGQRMDVIPLDNGLSIEDLLRSFPHRLDKIGWSGVSGEFIDPFSCRGDFAARQVRLAEGVQERSSESDVRYAALKSVYFVERHRFLPEPAVDAFINSEMEFTWFDRRNAVRLAQELLSRGGRRKTPSESRRAHLNPKSALALLNLYMQ